MNSQYKYRYITSLSVFFFPKKNNPSHENFGLSASEKISLPVKKSWTLPVKNQQSPWNFRQIPPVKTKNVGVKKIPLTQLIFRRFSGVNSQHSTREKNKSTREN